MQLEIITDTPELLIRRLVLQPGEAMYWHSDACRRFTVVIRGEQLTIEYADTRETFQAGVSAGLADWDEPEPRVHRAINTGGEVFEEVVTFFRGTPGQEPQPRAEPATE